MLNILVFFVVTFLIGLAIGNMRSPDWNNIQTAQLYIRDEARNYFDGTTFVKMKILCGTEEHVYDSKVEQLSSSLVSEYKLEELDYPKRGNINDIQNLTTAIFGSKAFVVAAVATNFIPSDFDDYAVGGVIVGGAIVGAGLITGYVVGYSDDPSCGAPAMSTTLKDEKLWRQVSARRLEARRLIFSKSMDYYCNNKPVWYKFETKEQIELKSMIKNGLSLHESERLDKRCDTMEEAELVVEIGAVLK